MGVISASPGTFATSGMDSLPSPQTLAAPLRPNDPQMIPSVPIISQSQPGLDMSTAQPHMNFQTQPPQDNAAFLQLQQQQMMMAMQLMQQQQRQNQFPTQPIMANLGMLQQPSAQQQQVASQPNPSGMSGTSSTDAPASPGGNPFDLF
jgi:hypothetical protein